MGNDKTDTADTAPKNGDTVRSRDGGNVVGVITLIDGAPFVVNVTPLDESHSLVAPDENA